MSFTPRFLMSKKVQYYTAKMVMEITPESKWEGKVQAKLEGPKADQVWIILQDFFNLHKWFPSLTTCYGIEGISGQPGCIRYCAGSSIPASSSINGRDGDVTITNWSTERLVDIDSVQRSITYEIVDCNIGFKSYVSTMKVVPYNNGENDEDNGCLIEWSFVVDPIQGWELETLVSKFDSGLQRTASKIEATLNNK
ncbi:hypothetical protein C5167_018645 [Papaver somniferum]|uniref:Bet v I/Major latex protein domain-containing protein n=3 Tax=Papaver somniferum TaxID=3469 RepID=A0A4Y7IR70_PAPSO|nr:hypothetical protein C5167_018645 [Papaver somniferum]